MRIIALLLFIFLNQNIKAQEIGFDFGNSFCSGCPENLELTVIDTGCGCFQLVGFVDGLADLPTCYSYQWDFGPYELSSTGANSLTPSVCFDPQAIFDDTGQVNYQTVTIYLDVWKNRCHKVFPITLTFLTC